jgi:hypothetical protein
MELLVLHLALELVLELELVQAQMMPVLAQVLLQLQTRGSSS